MLTGSDRNDFYRKKEVQIFFGVLFYAFIFQLISRAVAGTPDYSLWASQIQYFLNDDPRVFDFYGCYGHPGTTLVELGSLLHIFFGVSYGNAVTLSTSMLVAAATAACAAMCSHLFPRSIWWVTTSFLLLLYRPHMWHTPTTSLVMPLTLLIVLDTWWIWEQPDGTPKWACFLWGAVAGLSAATRFDVSIVVSIPMFMLLWYRHGSGVVLPLLSGAAISFFAADPFLWSMPFQHLFDLVRKFTLHYAHFPIEKREGIELLSLVRGLSLPAVAFTWSFFLLGRGRLARIIPIPVLIIFFGVFLLALAVVLTSAYQTIRYLSPLIIVGEVLLPLIVMETLVPTNRDKAPDAPPDRGSIFFFSIIVLLILFQFAYLMLHRSRIMLSTDF